MYEKEKKAPNVDPHAQPEAHHIPQQEGAVALLLHHRTDSTQSALMLWLLRVSLNTCALLRKHLQSQHSVPNSSYCCGIAHLTKWLHS